MTRSMIVEIALCCLIAAATFVVWEGVAWLTHKYIMHGLLWSWHRSHHLPHHRRAERNDLFAAIFSLPCIAMFYYFTQVIYNPYMLSVAIGIFCYGVFYVIFHDIIVHQRIRWMPRRKSKYLQRMINAHYAHHRKHSRTGGEAFGFLFASRKYAPAEGTARKSQYTP